MPAHRSAHRLQRHMSVSTAELSRVRAFTFDIDGVLTERDVPVAGAIETVAAIKQEGVPVRFLTNTTSRSRSVLAEGLVRAGFQVAPEEVFCPSAAAGEYLLREGASAHLLVRQGAIEDFAGVKIDDQAPDAVVVGDLAHEWSFERLNRAFQMIKEGGARLIGLGRTRYWEAEGGLQLDAGPFIAALEHATGQEALVFGKPDRAIFETVIASIGLPADQVAMVGDDILSDIEAAIGAGMIGVLVRTGKFRAADLEGPITPDVVLDSVADLLR